MLLQIQEPKLVSISQAQWITHDVGCQELSETLVQQPTYAWKPRCPDVGQRSLSDRLGTRQYHWSSAIVSLGSKTCKMLISILDFHSYLQHPHFSACELWQRKHTPKNICRKDHWVPSTRGNSDDHHVLRPSSHRLSQLQLFPFLLRSL